MVRTVEICGSLVHCDVQIMQIKNKIFRLPENLPFHFYLSLVIFLLSLLDVQIMSTEMQILFWDVWSSTLLSHFSL